MTVASLRFWGVLAALVFVGGCASGPAYQILTPFHDNDFRLWKESGPYTVTGEAFLRQPSGKVITCAGETISLMPLTDYNLELSKLLESGKGYPPNYDRRAHRYDKKVMCDASGKFTFKNLPALNWLLITRVTWQEDGLLSFVPFVGGPTAKGGWLFQEVDIADSQPDTTVHVSLTNDDFVADKN